MSLEEKYIILLFLEMLRDRKEETVQNIFGGRVGGAPPPEKPSGKFVIRKKKRGGLYT